MPDILKKAINVYYEIYGCEMNKSQAHSLISYLGGFGINKADDIMNADFVIIFTCAVRKSAEDRTFGRLGYFKYLKQREKPFLKVIIAGCMSEEYTTDFISQNLADFIVGTKSQGKILNFIKDPEDPDYKFVPALQSSRMEFLPSSTDNEYIFKAYTTIIHGCSNYCSYCIVPFLRGTEISRKSGEIIDDIKSLADKGVKEIVLLGQNVNAYGKDNGDVPFYRLLEKIENIEGLELISFLSPHPKDFNEALIKTMAGSRKISRSLHLPLQSGSDRMLKIMRRQYTFKQYKNIVDLFLKYIPDILFTTDIIVGFSDETEDDFNQTLSVMKEINFMDAFTYKYSKRPLTSKAFPDNIPENVKEKRLAELIDLQLTISIKKRKEHLGKIKKSIILKQSKKNKNEMLFKTFDGFNGVVSQCDLNSGEIIRIKMDGLAGKTFKGSVNHD